MLTHAGFWILEAAFRSLLMAVAVWAGIRLLRVQAVLAQKVAWVLVLVAAGTMPLVMHVPWLALDRIGFQAIRIPVRSLRSAGAPAVPPAVASSDPNSQASVRSESGARSFRIAKPSATHRAGDAKAEASLSIRPDQQFATGPFPVSDSGSQPAPVIPAPRQSRPATKSGTVGAIEQWSWARIRPILLFLYLAVGCALLLRTLTGLGIAYRIWRGSRPVTDLSDAFAHPGAPTSQTCSIRTNPLLTTPVTIGSTVILPEDFRQWDAAKLRIVLAHEQSHVRQGDFYLQLLAAIHAAIFWFSPLGWWLQRKLSELGEALSDRAGLEHAPNAASYAQILLEFAATPRTTPIAGVAMARSSNLSSRIERILNARNFHLAFLCGPRHAVLAAIIVPAALVAAIAGVRIEPAVQAAQSQSATPVTGQASGVAQPEQVSGLATGDVSGAVTGQVSGQVSGQVTGQVTGQISGEVADQTIYSDQEATPPAPAAAPIAPIAPVTPIPPSPDVAPVIVPEPAPAPNVHVNVDNVHVNVDMVPEPPMPPMATQRHEGSSFAYSTGDNGEGSFAIVSGSGNVTISGHAGKELEAAKRKYHNNFIWFERDGKSYVITDPAIMAEAQILMKTSPALEIRKAELDRLQAKLNEEMAKMQPEIDRASRQGAEIETQMSKLQSKLSKMQLDKISEEAAKAFPPEEQEKLNKEMAELAPELAKIQVPGPEFAEQMAKLNAQLAELQSEKFKKLAEDMNKQFSEEKLAELQERIGDIQGSIGEIQGRIGERQGQLGEKQGEIGERMGRIGEEMGRIGEQQGRDAEAASRRLKSVLDQAVKNGKAVPIN